MKIFNKNKGSFEIIGRPEFLSEEKIINGSFTGNANGWELYTGTGSAYYDNNNVTVTYTGGSWNTLSQEITGLTNNSYYLCSFTLSNNNTPNSGVYMYFDNCSYFTIYYYGTGNFSFIFQMDAIGSDTLYIESDYDIGNTFTIDNISIREIDPTVLKSSLEIYDNANSKIMNIGNMYSNIVIGSNSLINNYTEANNNYNGRNNIAIGNNTLNANTIGYTNIAIGNESLLKNTTGTYNIGVGRSSLMYNTTGRNNTAIGFSTLERNVSGSWNIAIGAQALRNSVGDYNVAIGETALKDNTTGTKNVAIGNTAMYQNTTGCRNTAVGSRSMGFLQNGTHNSAVGYLSSWLNNSGSHNSAFGTNALRNNKCSRNTAFGAYALDYQAFATGNTAVGYRAGCNITGNTSNIIAIGCAAVTSRINNHTVWGNSSNNVCNCIAAAWTVASDCRDKTNIVGLSYNHGLPFINKLNPVAFNWDYRDTYVDKCGFEFGEKDGTLATVKKHYGVIAQDVKQAIEELGIDFDALGHDEVKDAYRITYEELIPSLIKGMQQLDKNNKDLLLRIIELENKIK